MTTLKKVKKHLKRIQPYLCDCKTGHCPDNILRKDVPWLIKELEKFSECTEVNACTDEYGRVHFVDPDGWAVPGPWCNSKGHPMITRKIYHKEGE